LVDDPTRAGGLRLPEVEPDTEEAVALGASYVTDVLLVRAERTPEGVDVTPFSSSRRAAWYSLGFLLRESAARALDVRSQELRVGLRVARPGGEVRTEVFLADDLENGAGYCTHLGRSEEFQRVISEAREFLGRLAEPGHSEQCDSSCYDCLRDYYNMAYHPLLDWRLGRDMLDLLEFESIDLSAWRALEEALAESFTRDFQGEVVALDGNVSAVQLQGGLPLLIIAHPLESQHPDYLSERLALAWADAESRSEEGRIVIDDVFNLLRRPGWVAAQLFAPA
jgi:hypothetical protein